MSPLSTFVSLLVFVTAPSLTEATASLTPGASPAGSPPPSVEAIGSPSFVVAATGELSPAAAAELLRKSDIAAFSPESFRARLSIAVLDKKPASMEVEVWRSGESRSLVRFLGPKEKGKYLVRLDRDLWFLAPGAGRPVRLAPAYRLRGSVSLDDLLGIHYARDYAIQGVTRVEDAGGPLVVFDLVANGPRAPYPRVHYTVRLETARPLRAEYLLPSGKTSTVVEFAEWTEGIPPRVRRLVLTDRLHSPSRTEVTLLELEERKIPDGLFDLESPAERKKLEEHEPSGSRAP